MQAVHGQHEYWLRDIGRRAPIRLYYRAWLEEHRADVARRMADARVAGRLARVLAVAAVVREDRWGTILGLVQALIMTAVKVLRYRRREKDRARAISCQGCRPPSRPRLPRHCPCPPHSTQMVMNTLRASARTTPQARYCLCRRRASKCLLNHAVQAETECVSLRTRVG
jgi:hypothetical protein